MSYTFAVVESKMTPKDPVLVKFANWTKALKGKIKAVYLFGSRARGTERPDSDYDLFLVVTDDFSREDKSRLYDGVMEVLFETGQLVSLKIRKEKEFQRLRELQTPFIENVLQEGIKIG